MIGFYEYSDPVPHFSPERLLPPETTLSIPHPDTVNQFSGIEQGF